MEGRLGRSLYFVGFIIGTLTVLTVSTTLAAQGQIVDVDPPALTVADGITDVGDILSNTPAADNFDSFFESTGAVISGD